MQHIMKPIQSSVELIASTTLESEIPSEFMPVMAARVSHNQDDKTGVDVEKDEKLVKYLAKHNHTSPFEHLSVTFRITCPILVAREWMRHRTQSYNEVSMRYTSDFIGEVLVPTQWRAQDDKNRQVGLEPLSDSDQDTATAILAMAYKDALRYYDMLLQQGVCREQARFVIPVGHMTHFYASANLLNWAKFCKLRCAEDAQFEIRELANQISEHMTELYPMPWKYLS